MGSFIKQKEKEIGAHRRALSYVVSRHTLRPANDPVLERTHDHVQERGSARESDRRQQPPPLHHCALILVHLAKCTLQLGIWRGVAVWGVEGLRKKGDGFGLGAVEEYRVESQDKCVLKWLDERKLLGSKRMPYRTLFDKAINLVFDHAINRQKDFLPDTSFYFFTNIQIFQNFVNSTMRLSWKTKDNYIAYPYIRVYEYK